MVAIVIPVFKRFEVSRRLFNCLTKIKEVKVVVVDDGNQSEYRNYCKEYGFIHLPGTGKLFWGGMINLGLDYLKSRNLQNFDRIIFANDDVIIDETSFYKLISLDADIVHPLVLDENMRAIESGAKLLSKYFLFTNHPFRGLDRDVIPNNKFELIDIFTGRFLVMRPDVIDQLIGIRTDYFLHYGGDSDFGLRSRRHFKAFVYSGAHITLNTSTTSNSLKLNVSIVDFTKSLFKFKSASYLLVKLRLIYLNIPSISVPFNILLLIPYSYAQFFYSKWKK